MQKLLLLAISLTLSMAGLAQDPSMTQTDSVDIDPHAVINSMLSQLDMSSISTGLLLDKAVPFARVKNFDGQAGTDTLYGHYHWNDVYNTLVQSEITSNAGPPAASTWAGEADVLLQNGTIPFRSLHYNYHAALSDSAQLFQRIYWDGQYFHNTSGQPSPWVQHTTFAAGPAKNRLINTLDATFIVKSQYLFGNTGKTIDQISIDFDNGSGPQTISLNENINVSWPDTGLYTITYTVNYTDNSQYTSHSLMLLKDTRKSTQASGGYNEEPDDSVYITSGKSQNLGLMMQIEYGCGNNKLLKPFIFVEGWNPPSILTGGATRGNRYNRFWSKLVEYTEEFPDKNQAHLNIIAELQEGGYDIVYIDFDQGAGNIIENAYALEAAIKWVNEEKNRNGSTTPNVLWGESMGGLVSRVALCHMEQDNNPATKHDCAYYISFDSPQRGMNLPYGYQQMLQHTHHIIDKLQDDPGVSIFLPNLSKDMTQGVKDLLDLPATKQMLIYNSEYTIVAPDRIQFQQTLDALGMPQNTVQNIAIANGNGTSTSQGFNTLQKLLAIHGNSFNLGTNIKFKIGELWAGPTDLTSFVLGTFAALSLGTFASLDFDVYAMPGTTSTFHKIYKGEFKLAVLFHPVVTDKRTVKVSNAIPYDNAPAGNWDIDDLSDGLTDDLRAIDGIAIYHSTFGFTPTVSVLNISSLISNPHASLPSETNIISQNLSPFKKAHVYQPNSYMGADPPAGNNEQHTTFTPSNVDIMNDIMFNHSNDINTQSSNTLAQRTYNFGENRQGTAVQKTNDRLTRNLTVRGTSSTPGILCVNCNDVISYTDITSNPTANTASFSVILTGNCEQEGSELTIDEYGILEIGSSNMKEGVFTVSGKSTLRIKENGILKVKDGAKLIIQDNANFIFEEGAQIELQGFGSVLKVQGKLTIANNANFTFTGNGKLVFDQDVKWAYNGTNYYLKHDEYWDIGSNASFTVIGSTPVNYDRQLILVEKPLYLRMEGGNTFNSVNIQNGRVALNDGALFFSYSPTTLRFVKLNGYYPWTSHGGFRLWNNTGPNTIFLSKFSEGNPAALFHWAGGGPSITLTGCEFTNNEIGLQVEGGSFNVYGGTFNDNYDAIKASNLTGNSVVSSTQIDGANNTTQNGIYAHSQNGAFLNIIDSEIQNCRDGITIGGNISSRVQCSDIKFSGRYGILSTVSSSLDIGEHAENVFANNANDIYMTGNPEGMSLFLDNGYNDFAQKGYGAGMYLIGRFSDGMPTFLSGINQIPADYNKMPTYTWGGLTYRAVDFTWKPNPSSNNWTQVTLTIPNPQNPVQQDCRSTGVGDPVHTGHYRAVEGLASSGGVISTSGYGSTPLKNAALDAMDQISFGEELRDDGYALANLIEILESPVSGADNNTEKIRAAVYQQMHQALNNAYQYGVLSNVQGEGDIVGDTLQSVVDLIFEFINNLDLNDSNQHFTHFRYNLDMAHAYRVGGYYDQALTVLENSSTWTYNTDQADQANYWECVCTAESQYFSGELPSEEFTIQLDQCNAQYYGNNYKSSEARVSDSKGYIVENAKHIELLEAFPQPAISNLTVVVHPEYSGNVSYNISDLSGKLLKKSTVEFNGHETTLDVEFLKTGVYLLTFQFESGTKALKFSKK